MVIQMAVQSFSIVHHIFWKYPYYREKMLSHGKQLKVARKITRHTSVGPCHFLLFRHSYHYLKRETFPMMHFFSNTSYGFTPLFMQINNILFWKSPVVMLATVCCDVISNSDRVHEDLVVTLHIINWRGVDLFFLI